MRYFRLGCVAVGAILSCATPAFAQATPQAVDSSLRPTARPVTDAETVSRSGVTLVSLSAVRPVLRPANTIAAGMAVEASVSNQGFANWIRGFRGRALSTGISARTFDRAFRGIQYNASVVRKDRNQSEFTKQIWEYLDFAVSPSRVTNGRKMVRKYGRTLNRIEAHYGVDKEVVTAIWGMESAYGARRGDTPLIEALATLAYDGRRGRFFEKQLIAALKIVQAGDVAPELMTGSWAGAMGHTQFIPTSYLAYAVDFTGDGRRDIWSDDPTDALASAAAYLSNAGWRRGQPWGVEVRLPAGFAGPYGRGTRRSPQAWAAQGVRAADGRTVPDYGPASILAPAEGSGPAFMVFPNFSTILRYNNSESYAIGVGHLSDRLAGGGRLRTGFPPDRYGLSLDDRTDLQRGLNARGYEAGTADGVIGDRTRAAIAAYQNDR